MLYYKLSTFSNFICCCSMEFLYRSGVGDGPLVAFGASDGVIRVLSMMTWKVGNQDININLITTASMLCDAFVPRSSCEGTLEVIKEQSLA